MDVRSGLALLVLVACSGTTSAPKKVIEDARGSSAPAADGVPVAKDGKGDVQVRVEWKDVPPDARTSPGRTPCETPRPPAVAPTTLWGIPDVFVVLDVAGAAPSPRAAKRITYERCALEPRVAITGGSLIIASGTETPAKTFVQEVGQLPLGGTIADPEPRAVYLPTAGHEVSLSLDSGIIVRVSAGSEDAWVLATENPFVAITERSGSVVLREVPAGTHAVTAWLPPRSGQSARIARGTVTVEPGTLAEVTLDISQP